MQISTREEDFIIDTLELRSEMYVLNEAFTDPAIVKVMDRDGYRQYCCLLILLLMLFSNWGNW